MAKRVNASTNEIECCATCGNCIDEPVKNSYGDVRHFCISTGYYLHGIHKDRNTIKRFTPGGKELHCNYVRK